MDPNRKLWNEGHKRLRQALSQPAEHATVIDLFMSHRVLLQEQVNNGGMLGRLAQGLA